MTRSEVVTLHSYVHVLFLYRYRCFKVNDFEFITILFLIVFHIFSYTSNVVAGQKLPKKKKTEQKLPSVVAPKNKMPPDIISPQ